MHLDALGSDRDELGASVDAAGVIWFASDRPGGVGGWDLYSAAPTGDGFTAPAPVVELNTQVWEFNPAVDAGGTTLVFTSINREGVADSATCSSAGGWGRLGRPPTRCH